MKDTVGNWFSKMKYSWFSEPKVGNYRWLNLASLLYHNYSGKPEEADEASWQMVFWLQVSAMHGPNRAGEFHICASLSGTDIAFYNELNDEKFSLKFQLMLTLLVRWKFEIFFELKQNIHLTILQFFLNFRSVTVQRAMLSPRK